jgi:hypothetical protein
LVAAVEIRAACATNYVATIMPTPPPREFGRNRGVADVDQAAPVNLDL